MKTTLFAVSFAVLATTVYAQAPQPDFSKVEIKTTKITNNFYTLDGQGGTIGVLVGPEGIFMVDSQFAPLSQKIVDRIESTDVNSLTPLQALNLLEELQQELKKPDKAG